MQLPIIALAMGDPAGIGPEIVVKLLAEEAVYRKCRPFVIGDLAAMQEIAQTLRSPLRFRPVDDLAEARFASGEVEVLRPEGLTAGRAPWGTMNAQMGKSAALCLETGIELGQAGRVHGMVAAPMSKEAFHLAGYNYMDELSYLAELTHSADTFIAGLVGKLWTATVTEHIAFRDIAGQITRPRVLAAIRRLDALLRGVGRDAAKIAVAALNPHGGEGGLFGDEESAEISPAIREARRLGIDAHGPFAADTLFIRAAAEGFDAVLCLYHDQANIARKLLATWDGATVFAGLPIYCATTAHGTAFDKAGQGVADPGSLRAALNCVAALASSQVTTTSDFRAALNEIFALAEEEGHSFVDLKAGDLHRKVGGYPGHNHRMPVCCDVMRNAMAVGDTILYAPPKGKGATLEIRYRLPR